MFESLKNLRILCCITSFFFLALVITSVPLSQGWSLTAVLYYFFVAMYFDLNFIFSYR